MNKNNIPVKFIVLGFSLIASSVMAALPQAEADRLGAELTPQGAQKEGNASGTIPAWIGGLAVNAGAVERGFMSNPIADDKPLLSLPQPTMNNTRPVCPLVRLRC
ncbi:hypothetical protein SAMN05216190_14225 [Pseudomonas borbori]|uniref:DUF1329 domain-containing protein n=1 Tax=Pseudomonas borbori TaxID=289003 RepID=A0A1I5WQK9_9PSED|nr:hypothetical protein SAMN05216190_14225 [Pseudomonas borbori]